MTEQITIKLNKEQFKPLLDKLQAHAGYGIASSDSDMVGKMILFMFNIIVPQHKNQDNKTLIEQLLEPKNMEKADAIIAFLNDYAAFKKLPIEEYIEKKTNEDW